MGGTIKQNITFGHRWDPVFYEEVLGACALREDLAVLPDGDEVRTLVVPPQSRRDRSDRSR